MSVPNAQMISFFAMLHSPIRSAPVLRPRQALASFEHEANWNPQAQARQTLSGSRPTKLVWRNRAFPFHDQAIGLRLTVFREIEDGLTVALPQVEITARRNDFVLERDGLSHNLPRRRDDRALTHHVRTFFNSTFRGSDDPCRVLVRAGLHGEMVVELSQAVDILVPCVVIRRVVSEHHQFDALKAHNAVGFRPSAVVADAHAHHAAESAPNAEPEVSWLEIAFLQMLVGAPVLGLGMARKVHFTIFPDDGARAVDEDRSVETTLAPRLQSELCIAEIKANPKLLRLLEQRMCLWAWHRRFVVRFEFRLVSDQPPREESCERQFGEDDEFRASSFGLAHHR